MKENKRICGLITDFGTKDYFVGTLKGVMKQIAPAIDVIDICSDIPSFNILAAAFVIDKTFSFFPAQTIFLVVVDPGVGTQRRILLVQLGQRDRFFIAPDNGVLTPILSKPEAVVSILDKEEYFLTRGPSTFEARDKMAPAAAYLAAGVEPGKISSPLPVGETVVLCPGYFPRQSGKRVLGLIAYIDKYGNIMTNISREFLATALDKSGKSTFKAVLNGKEIEPYYDTYGQAAAPAVPFMLTGSHGNLEIAVNQGSAADLLRAGIGQEIEIII